MRVVLTDDHRIVREGLRMILDGASGIEIVGEATDGDSLLALLETTPADIVLLDLAMEGMGGLDTIPLVSERHPSVRVVVLSMHDRPSYVRKAISCGANGYLLKSASREALIDALETVHAGGTYVQADLAGPLVSLMSGGGQVPSMDLTVREREVLQHLADGLDTEAMAEKMGISSATVKTHIKRLFARMGVHSRAEAVAMGIRREIID